LTVASDKKTAAAISAFVRPRATLLEHFDFAIGQ
jgi:hypothetical protein